MKTALFLLVATFSAQVFAMDFSGVDTKEIPIRMSTESEHQRALILRTPKISEIDWSSMNQDERIEVAQQLAAIEMLQRAYLNQESANERAEDLRLNPQALCTAKFGQGYEYTGRVERQLPNHERAASYLCTKFGPSQRTPYEKRMIQLKGYVAFVKFKLRHPLSVWPG